MDLAPVYSCVDAFRLAARCTLNHDLALEYLRRALEACHAECDFASYSDPRDMTVWVGNERLRLIRRSIVECEAKQLSEGSEEGDGGPC